MSQRAASFQGLLFNFGVADVDAEWERFVIHGGLDPVLSPHSEDFGRRSFVVADPTGALTDVITLIEPTSEYADQFRE